MIDLTFDEAVSLVRRAIDEKGADYVYPQSERSMRGNCQYFRDGKPSCIVGYVLSYKGVTSDDLSHWDNEQRGAMALGFEAGTESVKVVNADEITLEFLDRVQHAQDSRNP